MSVRTIFWVSLAGLVVMGVSIAFLFSLSSGMSPAPSPPRHVTSDRSPTLSEKGSSRFSPSVRPRFSDIHEKAGLTEPHFNAADGRFRLVETMGSGVALIDFDGDGWLDVYTLQGCTLPYHPGSKEHTARLYRNHRDGTFTDVTARAGVGFNGYGQGVAAGDYDGDGHLDLYVSAMGTGALYRNRGDGTFTDVTERAGVAGGGWATSCAFADLDNDGDLDLYVCHYLADTIDAEGHATVRCNATPGHIGYCPPDAFAAEPDVLYRNNSDGTFTDVSADSGIAAARGKGLGVAIADLDDDGQLDVFVANDQTPNLLWRNLGGLKFEDVAVSWGVAYSETGQLRSGMGVAAGDYDGDGRLDLLVTNFYEEGDTLYRNAGPGDFQVTTTRARLTAPSRGTLGFGTTFLDVDRDGRLDLFVANGHLNDVRPLGMPYRMPPQLFWNDGKGAFLDLSSESGDYFQGHWLGRGAAVGDLDNDGDEDIVVTHVKDPPAVLRNDTTKHGHFLSVTLRPRRGAGPCVGARVVAEVASRRLVRFLAGGTSYLSANDSRILIGVGDASRIDRLEIRWPSGKIHAYTNVEVDQFVQAREESPTLQPIADPLHPNP
jgi:hypothetical protein